MRIQKIHNCALLLDLLVLFLLYQYKIQIPIFSQFFMITFSHNNQQLVTVTVIAVSCFSH